MSSKDLMETFKEIRHYLTLVPGVFWLFLFLFVPLAVMAIFSFWSMVEYKLIPEWTLKNYAAVITSRNGLYIKLLLKSLGMSVAATIASISMAYPMAYYISRYAGKYKYLWINVIIAPYMISWVITLFGWRTILGYGGLINFLLMKLGLISKPITWLWHNWGAVIFVLTVGWAPWLVLPIFVSLEKIDESLLEAARDMGASPMQTFLTVTLPLSIPGLLLAVFFVLIPTFGEFVAPRIAGGTSGAMYGMAIEDAFIRMANWPFASAMTFLLLAISLVIAIILIRRVGLETLMEAL